MAVTGELCSFLLGRLGWDWEHPRVASWLSRVREHYGWGTNEPLPDFVLISLSKFLNLYVKCNSQLGRVNSSWNDKTVTQIEARFRLQGKFPTPPGTLSLEGYKYLHDILSQVQQIDLNALADDEIVF